MDKKYIYLIFALAIVQVSCDSTKDFECTEEGAKCGDCVTSYECVLEDDDYNVTVTDCGSGQTCNTNTGLCMSNPNPQCHGIPYRFVCTQTGVFPHPLDCTRYYMCVVDGAGSLIATPKDMTCKAGYAYDASTNMCTKKFTGTCDFIINGACVRPGTEGAVLDNVYMYFYCLNVAISGEQYLTPQLFFCLNGQKYVNGICRDEPPRPTIPLDNGKCSRDGDIYDPNDCRRYFHCIEGEEPVRTTCDTGFHFDGWAQICVAYECPK